MSASSTPVELFSSQVALLEDNKKDEKTAPNSRRKAIFAGASVGGGALLLGILLIGGTLLATNTGDILLTYLLCMYLFSNNTLFAIKNSITLMFLYVRI